MSFADILDNLGGMGHFQRISVAFLAIPLLMLASHNLLQNFTAGVPEHHCQIHITANHTRDANATKELGADSLIRIAIPVNRKGQPEKCLQFVTTQWWLLEANATTLNDTTVDTEPCSDGWTYDRSVFTSTIISEVREASGGEKHLEEDGFIRFP